MSLDTTAYEADIVSQIKSVCPRTYVTAVPDSVPTPGYPYVIVTWGEPFRANADRHMDNSRHDSTRSTVFIEVYSKDDASANATKNAIKNVLTGYIPPDCAEMILESGHSGTQKQVQPKPTLFIRELTYSFFSNMAW